MTQTNLVDMNGRQLYVGDVIQDYIGEYKTVIAYRGNELYTAHFSDTHEWNGRVYVWNGPASRDGKHLLRRAFYIMNVPVMPPWNKPTDMTRDICNGTGVVDSDILSL